MFLKPIKSIENSGRSDGQSTMYIQQYFLRTMKYKISHKYKLINNK